MKIILSGYGKMGKEIEKIALQRGHEIFLILNDENDWSKNEHLIKDADVAIDFSTPHTVVNNIYKFFNANIPVITGTTGWNDKYEEVKAFCLSNNQSLFFASNFSIGVNMFFALNKKLASMMNEFAEYDVTIEETHHTQKLDSPSGTAITIAEDIIKHLDRKNKWTNAPCNVNNFLEIKSHRIDNITGTHNVIYNSDIDTIEIIHTAKNRKGFVQGAVMAAEWIIGKKGVFGMNDMLNF